MEDQKKVTLYDMLPEISAYWMYEKNGDLRPESLAPKSCRYAYVRCPSCGKERFVKIGNLWKKDDQGKPYLVDCSDCCQKQLNAKRRILAYSVCPEFMDWWNPEENPGTDPKTITVADRRSFNFTCPECGNVIKRQAQVFLRKSDDGTYHPVPCQKCHPSESSLKVALTDAVPDIRDFWDYEAMGGVGPEKFGKSSPDKVVTRCPVCGKSVTRSVRFTWTEGPDGVGHVIHCRSCGKRKDVQEAATSEKAVSSGVIDFYEEPPARSSVPAKPSFVSVADICPDIKDYWMYDGNEKKPEEFPHTSSDYVWVRCPSCGKPLQKRCINLLSHNEDGSWSIPSCMECGFKKRSKTRARNNYVLEKCPEFQSWWDPSNERSLDTISLRAKYDAKLICPACHYHFHRIVKEFISLHRDGSYRPVGCPSCGYSARENPENNLLKECPEIRDWWDYDKNAPLLPEQFTKGSQQPVHLKCPECGMNLYTGIHSLVETLPDGTVKIRHKGKCDKFKALESSNNIVKCYPEVSKWWDFEANKPSLPEEYTLFSTHKAYFRCPDCGTQTFRRIVDAFSIVKGKPPLFTCPYCNNTRLAPGLNDLATVDPELAKEWSPNNPKKPSEVMRTLDSLALWICPDCGGEYPYIIRDRRVGDKVCSCCKGYRVIQGLNDLATTDPELAKEYAPDNDRPVISVYKGRSVRVNWICPVCHGEYSYPLRDREAGDDSCPYCSGKKVLKGFNDLATTDPELAKEYAPDNDKTADEVVKRQSTPVNWICPVCHGEYSYPLRDREAGDDSCPYCSGKKVLKGFNSFDVTHKNLMSEWMGPENAILGVYPDEITDTYNKPLWWKCPICGYPYPMTPKKRVLKEKRKQNPCLKCNGRRWKEIHFF